MEPAPFWAIVAAFTWQRKSMLMDESSDTNSAFCCVCLGMGCGTGCCKSTRYGSLTLQVTTGVAKAGSKVSKG